MNKAFYSLDELTEIGREKFSLKNEWHCFFAEIQGDKLKYGLARKNMEGEWVKDSEEVYGYVPIHCWEK